MRPDDRKRSAAAAFCAVLVALPFLAVDVVPVTDLPQQTAQLRLLGDVLAGAQGYDVQWTHPNKLGYLPLALGWAVGGPLAAGRLGMLLIALAWVVAVHVLAREYGRPAEAAVLACLFVWSHATYWGFLNFLVGLPAFVLWLVVVRRLGDEHRRWHGPALLAAALVLYSAHVLWLAAAGLWLAVEARRWPWRLATLRAAWLLPVAAALAAWWLGFSDAGVDERTFWGRPPWARLYPSWSVGAALGGLRGPVEPMVLLAVLAWLAVGLWQRRRELRTTADLGLAALGVAFLAAVLLLPEVHYHTIFFAARWLPPAAVFLVLAAPSPRLAPLLRAAVPAVLLATLVAATTAAWIGFDRDELEGFEACLEALPEKPALLGLDLVRESPRIAGFPYHHLYALGQVLRGGELNRTFAGEASSLVVFDELPKTHPWTDDLDWKPERFRVSDRDYFDVILVHGRAEHHALFERDPALEPVTAEAPWRLYRVRAGRSEGLKPLATR